MPYVPRLDVRDMNFDIGKASISDSELLDQIVKKDNIVHEDDIDDFLLEFIESLNENKGDNSDNVLLAQVVEENPIQEDVNANVNEAVVITDDESLPLAEVVVIPAPAVKHSAASYVVPYSDLKEYIRAHVEGKTGTAEFNKNIGRWCVTRK